MHGVMVGLKPVQVLGERRAHGDRLRYMAGCRCLPCRAANSSYEVMRSAARKAGDWNGLVDARRARAHIHRLSLKGVGYKLVADAAGVSKSVMFKIMSGRRRQIRARTERQILGVGADCPRGDKSLVPAGPTWKRIGWLMEQGFTKKRIAQMLGYSSPAIQFNKQTVTARSEMKVEKLYRKFYEVGF